MLIKALIKAQISITMTKKYNFDVSTPLERDEKPYKKKRKCFPYIILIKDSHPDFFFLNPAE